MHPLWFVVGTGVLLAVLGSLVTTFAGALRSILRQADISPEELAELM